MIRVRRIRLLTKRKIRVGRVRLVPKAKRVTRLGQVRTGSPRRVTRTS